MFAGKRGEEKEEGERCLRADEEAGRILDGLLDLHEEGDGFLAVHEAVVVAQGEIHHRADDDLAVDGDGALVDGVEAEDGVIFLRVIHAADLGAALGV